MFGIEKNVYRNLIEYFEEKNYIKKVLIFGSRAKGNYKYNSDIDLGILCERKYRGTVKEDIDEIIGVYSADIVFLDSMNEEIKYQIERDGIEIYISGE
ncbi:nucleotidyltransferase domain-containing protein [Clostridium thermobutyricum]|uniref:nucleotidyltransferase family protein n=1 Tax=Clostridium thermobutyricum TaxID=29372 RepID=UPI0029436736|nr:nucleotidyltransferase domain-containing protein [Clostridium thermobutyricum]